MSENAEIVADLKPLMPSWQLFLGMLGVSLTTPVAYPQALDSPSVVFFVLSLVGIASVMAYLLRDKTIRVKLRSGDGCMLITDDWRPDPGKLVPSRIERKSEKIIEVERAGSRWEVKRVELRFANSQDAGKVVIKLERLIHTQSSDPVL